MDKYKRFIPGGVLAALLFCALIFLTNEVMAAPVGAPLMDEPTPTPLVDYWLGTSKTFTIDHTLGDQGLEAGWYMADVESTSTLDFAAPLENYPAGFLVTLNSTTYSGDTNLQHGSNTNWFQKWNDYWTSGADEQTPGETTCNGGSAACAAVGYEVEAAHDWEGYETQGDINFIANLHNYQQLGGATGTTSFTLRPIFYGDVDTSLCSILDPTEMDGVKTGTLLGTDEVGHLADLVEGETYLLVIMPGPWNDGADDREDAGIRFYDGAAWGEFAAVADYENEDAEIKDPCEGNYLEEGYDALQFTATSDMEQIQIRVNDVDDQFADNSQYLNYELKIDTGGYGQSCAGLWSKDDLVGSVTLDSTDDSYQYLQPGKMKEGLYALVITGTYLDNGASSDAVIMADFPPLFTSVHDNWDDNNFFTGAEYCDVEGSEIKEYYGSARNDFYDHDKTLGWLEAKPLAIADDGDANFSNNSGTVEVEVYTAGYTAPISDCATLYDRGTWLDSFVVFADSEDGLQIPLQTNGLVIGQTYYLETQGAPYSLSGSDSWDFEAGYAALPGVASSVTWSDPEVFFNCSTPLDENLTGYYFIADAENVWLRAEFGIFGHSENSGSVKFNLYSAVPYLVPEDESCGDYLQLDNLVYKEDIAADSTPGISIDYSVFDAGSEYAIKVVSPVYTDPDGTGKTGEIRRAGPGSGSVNYTSFEDWPSGTCYEQVDGYDYVYFTAQELSDYEVRATEPDDGNTGTMEFEVWELERGKEPIAGCEIRDYGDVDIWWVIKEKGIIYGDNNGEINNNPEVMANELGEAGIKYKLEIDYINSVIDIPSMLYELEISDNAGASWVLLEDWMDCWVDLSGPLARGYFTAPKAGGPFLLRVYDAGGNYYDNEGGLQYKMWIDSQLADPGDVGDFYDQLEISGWGTGCTAACPPPGWLEVGQWIEYARCRLTRWLAWCPWHAESIAKMQDEFYKIEPIGTLMDLLGLGLALKDEFTQYNWTDDTGGGDIDNMEIQAPRNFIFAPGEGGGADIPLVGADSVWGGGDIDLAAGLGSGGYSTECDNLLADSLGNLGPPMCFAANVINALGLNTWVQWLWDIAMMVGFGFYLANTWIKPNSS